MGIVVGAERSNDIGLLSRVFAFRLRSVLVPSCFCALPYSYMSPVPLFGVHAAVTIVVCLLCFCYRLPVRPVVQGAPSTVEGRTTGGDGRQDLQVQCLV